MKKVYLVKKDPSLPAGKENWIVMDSHGFSQFLKTPEGQKRKQDFGQMDGCDTDDYMIFAECGREAARQWRAEKDRHNYLMKLKTKMGYVNFSYHAIPTDAGSEAQGEDILKDENTNVEETVIDRLVAEKLRTALVSLNAEERHLVDHMFLTDKPVTEEQYARLTGKSRAVVHYRKKQILKKLEIMIKH